MKTLIPVVDRLKKRFSITLMLIKELQSRLLQRGWRVEWRRRLLDDLDELQELTMTVDEKTFVVRTAIPGDD